MKAKLALTLLPIITGAVVGSACVVGGDPDPVVQTASDEEFDSALDTLGEEQSPADTVETGQDDGLVIARQGVDLLYTADRVNAVFVAPEYTIGSSSFPLHDADGTSQEFCRELGYERATLIQTKRFQSKSKTAKFADGVWKTNKERSFVRRLVCSASEIVVAPEVDVQSWLNHFVNILFPEVAVDGVDLPLHSASTREFCKGVGYQRSIDAGTMEVKFHNRKGTTAKTDGAGGWKDNKQKSFVKRVRCH
jgi:hypothetical protein